MELASFVFNDFQENTYVLHDETKECIIIDPGCNNDIEKIRLKEYIIARELTPVKLVNTHCHIDHILGNKFIADTYNLELIAHAGEQVVLDHAMQVAQMYGIHFVGSPNIKETLDEGDELSFGNQKLKVLFTPGHSPASISFYHSESKTLIAGDVLFKGSIGRTDLPGGDHETLLKMIREKFFSLPDDTMVYPGHGPSTLIGEEKRNNPFFQ